MAEPDSFNVVALELVPISRFEDALAMSFAVLNTALIYVTSVSSRQDEAAVAVGNVVSKKAFVELPIGE